MSDRQSYKGWEEGWGDLRCTHLGPGGAAARQCNAPKPAAAEEGVAAIEGESNEGSAGLLPSACTTFHLLPPSSRLHIQSSADPPSASHSSLSHEAAAAPITPWAAEAAGCVSDSRPVVMGGTWRESEGTPEPAGGAPPPPAATASSSSALSAGSACMASG